MIEPCISCGHGKEYHIWEYSMWCTECAKPMYYPDGNMPNVKVHHSFKLDNLSYIEDLAKEKNLI